MLKRCTPILLAGALLAAPALSHALACGDVVTSSVTLSHDLDCTGSGTWFALEVRGDGVVIHLNGHTISGSDDMHGILVWKSSSVRILGGGRINGFNVGVNAAESPKLQVAGVEIADGGAGVHLSRSPYSKVAHNKFYRLRGEAVLVLDLPVGVSSASGNSLILDNEIGKVAYGVLLCGVKAGGNRIEHNRINAAGTGILITDHSGGNVVLANTLHDIHGTGIQIETSRGNTLDRNNVVAASIGVALVARGYADWGYCPLDPALHHNSSNHKIYDNTIAHTEMAIVIGDNLGLGKVFHSTFARNRIDVSDLGLYFQHNSHENAAFGTVFGGVVTPVIDLGSSNTW